jgi:phosphohistidine phosphatase
MALYLVQHGVSLPKEIDPDRPLSDEGKVTVERITQMAAGYNVSVSLIEHSGKTRARQTAEIMASLLNPDGGVVQLSGLDPNDDVTAVADRYADNDNVMIVGHLPFMERLVSYLITGRPDLTIFKFQNGGIVCLDKDPGSESWYIAWTLMPKIG